MRNPGYACCKNHALFLKHLGNFINTHEGTKVVRTSKLQMLVSQFKEIKMLEDETFDEFYSKLSVIRKSTINLEKKMDDAKAVKKILRSLPKRFIPQVAAVQQSKDLDTMSRRTCSFSLSDF
jgi:GTP1/Obg family GTP-binding protein